MRSRLYHVDIPEERVIELRDDGSVVTQRGRVRTTYHGVADRAYRVGDVLTEPPRHTTRSVVHGWSAWEGVDDDE